MALEVGDIVLCTVDRIVGTIVFVNIHDKNKEIEASIIFSEVSPGRIRNIRDFIVPKKKIVCKILRISGDRIDLSLRRVTQKEKKEIITQDKQEQSYKSILKSVLGEKSEEITKKIQQQDSIYDFLEEAKENSKKLEEIIGKQDSKKIIEILNAQKQKKSTLKKEIFLTTNSPNGIELIKKILMEEITKNKEIEIKYISAGKYAIKTEAQEIKIADIKLKKTLLEIEKKAKQQGIEFKTKEK